MTADDPDRGRTVRVVPSDPLWPRIFDSQAMRIRAALGAVALAIDHVGSTSVPGLAAKPVIDIHLVVRDSADESAYQPALERAGYRLVIREPDWFEHRMFLAHDPDVNLHVFSAGCPEPERCRLFRDWLCFSADDRALYAATKQMLAQRRWARTQDYADAKGPVIADIMTRAEAWRRARPR